MSVAVLTVSAWLAAQGNQAKKRYVAKAQFFMVVDAKQPINNRKSGQEARADLSLY